jgi:hypothetical protein
MTSRCSRWPSSERWSAPTNGPSTTSGKLGAQRPFALTPSARGPDDIECLLNPDFAGCEAVRNVEPGLDRLPTDKLGPTEISQGIKPVKLAVKDCGREHDAAPGTKVAIQFVLDGATGKVLSATALDGHGKSALGMCVAAKSKQAIFPTFPTAQQRFKFTFRI